MFVNCPSILNLVIFFSFGYPFYWFLVEYTIEYLDPEYENAMIDETIQNDEDEQSDEPEKKGRKQTKPQSKRTYPYKCTKCNKRFVYKEVYEAHIRIHKGLPGFSYVINVIQLIGHKSVIQINYKTSF